MNVKKAQKDKQRKLELKKMTLVQLAGVASGVRPPYSCTYC